jgi:DNA-binding NarL/FixJ family response regulator
MSHLEQAERIIRAEPQWTVVAEVANGELAVEKSAELKPQVVVLDWSMPEMSGLEATRRIREAAPETEVVILSVDEWEQAVREALSCGARGYVLKSDAGCDLVAAVKSASRHQLFVSPRVSLEMSRRRPIRAA